MSKQAIELPHNVIYPSSADEVGKAYRQIEAVQKSKDVSNDDIEDFIQKQEDALNERLKKFNDEVQFDYSYLAKNIDYLLEKSGLKIGQLEKALGYSAGYFSRTLGVNSKKKLSINAVYKIASMFKVDIQKLLYSDLELLEMNNI